MADASCPGCGNRIGYAAASTAFADYTRFCVELNRQAKGAFSIDFGAPLSLVCPGCSACLFYGYHGSRSVSLIDDEDEPDTRPNPPL